MCDVDVYEIYRLHAEERERLFSHASPDEVARWLAVRSLAGVASIDALPRKEAHHAVFALGADGGLRWSLFSGHRLDEWVDERLQRAA